MFNDEVQNQKMDFKYQNLVHENYKIALVIVKCCVKYCVGCLALIRILYNFKQHYIQDNLFKGSIKILEESLALLEVLQHFSILLFAQLNLRTT